MTRVVLDASAILALILNESDQYTEEVAEALLAIASVSAVNLVEVRTKLIDLSKLAEIDVEKLFGLGLQIEPFTIAQALLASDLRASTKQFGLSLGDRACLALALDTGREVYTCDLAWSRLAFACKIHQLR